LRKSLICPLAFAHINLNHPPERSMNALYLEDNGNAAGPYPLHQIRELLSSGTLTPERLASARPEGPWQALKEFNLANPVATPAAGGFQIPGDASEFQTIVTRILDAATSLCAAPFWRAGKVNGQVYSFYQDFLSLLGHYALLACGLIGFLISGVLAVKANSGSPLVNGLAFAVLMILGHYVAARFTAANRELLRRDFARLNSAIVPSFVAVLSLFSVLGVILCGLVDAVVLFTRDLAGALGFLVICLLWAFILFHAIVLSRECKELLQVETNQSDAPAADVLLNNVKFVARLQLALSFILMGAGGCTAALRLILAGFFFAFFPNNGATMDASSMEMNMQMAGNPILGAIAALNGLGFGFQQLALGIVQSVLIGFVPLISYVIYLLLILGADFFSALLRTARNTDRLPSTP